MILRYLLLLCALVLPACMTTAERAARMQAEVDEMVAVYGSACEKLGYKRDEDPWRACVLNLSTKDELRRAAYPTTSTCIGHRGFFHCSSF